MSQKTLDPSVFDEQQFGQIRFAQQHQSWSVPSLEDLERSSKSISGISSLERAASGDLKKAPNLGDNKRGYAGRKLAEANIAREAKLSYRTL